MKMGNNKRKSSGGTPRRKVTKSETYAAVRSEFLGILKRYGTATVDMIHQRLEIPDSARMLIGSAIGSLSRDGLIERVDFQKTERSKAHGRHVSVWRLTDAGLNWTSRNPRRVLTASR